VAGIAQPVVPFCAAPVAAFRHRPRPTRHGIPISSNTNCETRNNCVSQADRPARLPLTPHPRLFLLQPFPRSPRRVARTSRQCAVSVGSFWYPLELDIERSRMLSFVEAHVEIQRAERGDRRRAKVTVNLAVHATAANYRRRTWALHPVNKCGSSRFLVGRFHSFSSIQVRIFSRKYSSSRYP
jgi:hypothetical protein